MRTVGIRELKNKLSEYLRAVAAGETIAVTDRGRVVAELGPPRPGRTDLDPGLLELARRGLLQLPTKPHDPSFYRKKTGIRVPEGTAQELIDFIRGEDH
jgi:antitoxin (DNA-binding transcriptional repressor) of toxin-antitoxin stability system